MDRFVQLIARAATVTDGGGLSGYWAVYDQPTTRQIDFPGTETIGRGAFDGLLDEDVIATFNHEPSALLGRTSSGTLRLGSDDHGGTFDLDLPDTTLGRDLRVLVERGDLRGMSFLAQVGEVERTREGVIHRKFKRLADISIVTSPAYVGTEVMARNAAEARLADQLIRARHRALIALGGR